ncbi:MAG TPA: aminoacyl-tRNA hydrolase [Rhizomicrobium sp.]|jgi:PTH1 family peptidyl-tRNA hydrolase|nr:aminoacyl-tRNA hydrolase [Rhizomicrobium sp.]
MSDTPLLIAGLGNPGAEYARNRHNAGFMALDTIHASYAFGPWRARFHGQFAEGAFAGRKTFLLKPSTYMNESGRALGEAVHFFKLPLAAVVVIHDEIALEAAKLKVKTGGGDAGNNGARSITAAIGPDYRRVRIGVGHPGEKSRVSGHVLGNFSKHDEDWLVPMLSAIAEAAPYLAKDDDNGFMNKVTLLLHPPVHKPKPEPKEEQE